MTAPVVFMVALVIIVGIGWKVLKQKRDAAWKQLASEIGAEFIDCGFFSSSKVQAHIKDWTVVLDTYSVPSGDSGEIYTRMRAPLQNQAGFQFTLFRTGVVSRLDKALGARHVETGDPDFDRNFAIQGNNESKVRAFFTNQKIRQMLQAQRSIRLSVKGNELLFETQGFIKDVERLKSLFDLFKEALQQLEE
jgi:hypothetical protein